MKFWQKILRFFNGPTPGEAYINGYEMATREIAQAPHPAVKARELYDLASGGFNTDAADRAYDRGVNDAIEKWWHHG